jgi:hypothetical protein
MRYNVIFEPGQEPNGPEICPSCGQRRVIRLQWPEPQPVPSFLH